MLKTKSPNNIAVKNKKEQETKQINKSLFFLTKLILEMKEKKSSKYICFWNSPLTKLLKKSMNANHIMVMILCISDEPAFYNVSLSTLRFGKGVTQVNLDKI